jgi:CheY-like chemotaxis protein
MEFFRQRFILIAEDNRDLAMSLSNLLKLVGFEVETVHDGRDAVTVARTRKPDVLLLDIGLPGMDGYQVAAAFRSDAKLKDTFIIANSGYFPRDVFRNAPRPRCLTTIWSSQSISESCCHSFAGRLSFLKRTKVEETPPAC